MNYKKNQVYTAGTIAGASGIYDKYIALVDNKLECLDMWISEEAESYMNEDNTLSEEDAYNEAVEYVLYNISEAYPDAKKIITFKGIAPSTTGFWCYFKYTCIDKEIIKKG